MNNKFPILIVFMLFASVMNSQYFTKTQIISINSSSQAYEGDIYIDSVNNDYYIGHADGRLSQINQSIDSVVFLSDTAMIYYWNFKESDTIDISPLNDSSEWIYDNDKGVALRRANISNATTDDSVVFATHGRLIIADSISQTSVYQDPNSSTQIYLSNLNSTRDVSRQISIENKNTAGNKAYSLYTSSTDSSTMYMGSHGSSRTLTRLGFPVKNNNEIVAVKGGLHIGTRETNPIYFGTKNTFRVVIDTNGNTGINTKTPLANLHVYNDSVLTDKLSSAFVGNYVDYLSTGQELLTPNPYSFFDEGRLRVYGKHIRSDIDHTSEGYTSLHPKGLIVHSSVTGTEGLNPKGVFLRVSDGASPFIENEGALLKYPLMPHLDTFFENSLLLRNRVGGTILNGISLQVDGDIRFFQGNNPNNTKTKMILHDANLGIGEIDPEVRLDIKGTNDTISFTNDHNFPGMINLLTTERGIGSESSIVFSSNYFNNNRTVINSSISSYQETIGSSVDFGQASLVFKTSGNTVASLNTEKMRITGLGNVGIGTDSPSDKLDIDGTLRVREMAEGSATDSIVTTDANGQLRKRSLDSIALDIKTANVINKTASYTIQETELGAVFTFNSATDVTLTIPAGLPIGYNISVYQIGLGKVTIAGAVGVTVKNRLSIFKTAGQDAGAGIVCTATNVFHITGDLTN